MPPPHLFSEFGRRRHFEEDYPMQTVPPSLIPFVVKLSELPDFLTKIYEHAKSESDEELVNPLGVPMLRWRPRLQPVEAIGLPQARLQAKFDGLQWLYEGFQLLGGQHCVKLVASAPLIGEFELDRYLFDHRLGQWFETDGCITFITAMAPSRPIFHSQVHWHLIYAENTEETKGFCIPRDEVPSGFWVEPSKSGVAVLLDEVSDKEVASQSVSAINDQRTLRTINAAQFEHFIFDLTSQQYVASNITKIVEKHGYPKEIVPYSKQGPSTESDVDKVASQVASLDIKENPRENFRVLLLQQCRKRRSGIVLIKPKVVPGHLDFASYFYWPEAQCRAFDKYGTLPVEFHDLGDEIEIFQIYVIKISAAATGGHLGRLSDSDFKELKLAIDWHRPSMVAFCVDKNDETRWMLVPSTDLRNIDPNTATRSEEDGMWTLRELTLADGLPFQAYLVETDEIHMALSALFIGGG